MSLYVFLSLCILGIDFLIYVFFQWTYGDKRRATARKLAALRNPPNPQAPRPFLVATHTSHLATLRRIQSVYEPENQRKRITLNQRPRTAVPFAPLLRKQDP